MSLSHVIPRFGNYVNDQRSSSGLGPWTACPWIDFFLKEEEDVTNIHFHWPPCCSLLTNPLCGLKWSLCVPERTLAQTGPLIRKREHSL